MTLHLKEGAALSILLRIFFFDIPIRTAMCALAPLAQIQKFGKIPLT